MIYKKQRKMLTLQWAQPIMSMQNWKPLRDSEGWTEQVVNPLGRTEHP